MITEQTMFGKCSSGAPLPAAGNVYSRAFVMAARRRQRLAPMACGGLAGNKRPH